MKRLLTIAFSALLPRLRLRFYDPSGAEVSRPGGRGWEYPCFSCGAPSETGGYQPHETRRKVGGYRRSLCARCHARQRRWHWLTWLETGERVEVPEVRGEGFISPSTTYASHTYPVYRLFGREFVFAHAARHGRQNSLNARFWFRRLGVEGNSQGVERATKAQGNVLILPLADD